MASDSVFGTGIEMYVWSDAAQAVAAWAPESIDARQLPDGSICGFKGRHLFIFKLEGGYL